MLIQRDTVKNTIDKSKWNSHGKQEKENRERENTEEKQKTKNKMADLGTNIATFKLNVNGLNPPIKNIDFHCGFKNMTQLYSIYKKLTL